MVKRSPKKSKMFHGNDEVVKGEPTSHDYNGAKYPSPEYLPKKRKIGNFVSADMADGIKPEIKDTVDNVRISPGRNSQVY